MAISLAVLFIFLAGAYLRPQTAQAVDRYTVNSTLRHNPGVSGEQLDSFIRDREPFSPLIGLGQTFVNAGAKYNIDPVYLMSHALLESGWGFSWISLNKKNIFGWEAYDRDAEGMATSFPTYEVGVDYVAFQINSMYLTPGGDYYTVYGPTLRGMNVHYASGKTWADNIAAIMNDFAGRIPDYPYPHFFREYDASYAKIDVPALIQPSLTYQMTVKVDNNGEADWPKDGAFKLTYVFIDSAGNDVGEGEVLMPEDIKSGRGGFLHFAITSPPAPGKYTLRFDMLHEGRARFSRRDVTPLEIPVEVIPDSLYYKAAYMNTSLIPERAYAGTVYTVSTNVTNVSSALWPAQLTKLGYQWLDAQTGNVVSSGKAQNNLDKSMFPAESSMVRLDIRTPSQPGCFILKLDLIDNESIWFASKGSPTVSTLVQVLPDFGATYKIIGGIQPFYASTPQTVNVNILNTSKMTWPKDGQVRLAYSFVDAGAHQGYEARIPMPQDVYPGGNITIPVNIMPPLMAGSYNLTFDLVFESLSWFSQQGVAPFSVPVSVSYDLRVSYSNVDPGTPVATATTDAKVTLTNTSNMIWPANGPVKLSYSFSDTGAHEGYTARISVPKDVHPQETITLTVPIVNPATPGIYTLRFDLIDERVIWFSQNYNNTPSHAVYILPPDGASYQWAIVFPHLRAGTDPIISVRVTNEGNITWDTNGRVRLSYSFTDTGDHQGYDARIAMPHPVAPGETIDLTVPLVVPSSSGRYTLKFDLIDESVTWFSLQGIPQKSVSIEVTN